ncbi:MAG: hypothetical protein MZV63_69330 [Marinilabiliales bacterium]|nr:hypothetical protein [Marinilabiliales bacterium]
MVPHWRKEHRRAGIDGPYRAEDYTLTGVTGDMSERQRKIASEILKEIRSRLGFLLDVGLDYLSLNQGCQNPFRR